MPDRSLNNNNAGRPRMCQSCGAIVGAGQEQCAVCGTSVTSPPNSSKSGSAPDRETLRFARAVLNRPYKFTIVLLVANLFVFLLMWQASGIPFSLLAPLPNEVLIPFGAKLNYLIQTKHQWWRFVTPMFLHVNGLHLMVNMYSLWVVGPYVEKLYGSAKFVVFWVLTGVAGVIASYLTVKPGVALGPIARFIFKAYDDPSAGASGALFGLVGILFVFGIKFRHELPEGFKRAFGTGLLPMIMLNLFIGYVGRGFIDNAAHLGGMVCGGMLALVVDYRRPGERSRIAVTWQVLRIAAIAVVVVSFIKTAQHFKDPIPATMSSPAVSSADSSTEKFVTWAKAMNDGQEAFYFALKDSDTSRSGSAVKQLESAPSLDPKADELKERLKLLLTNVTAVQVRPVNSNQPSSRKAGTELQQLAADFQLWSKDYNTWLKTTGRTYGLVQTTDAEPSPQSK
ncbi:MAG: rhomboid family intramembrane serine protease [Pyrinomonadaceae bacterium]